MSGAQAWCDVEIYTTCPQSKDFEGSGYVRRIVDVARWSEELDCRGALIYTGNGLIDPWSVAEFVIQNTSRLAPLVAVQPVYMHPYWVAKKIKAIAYLYGRPVALNMLAGGFKADLAALEMKRLTTTGIFG